MKKEEPNGTGGCGWNGMVKGKITRQVQPDPGPNLV